jgi:hypothetical protein
MTKRMAGMQPYFFPYLGYWQLIGAVDCFVLFDEAQYIKQGWVNRNRVLKQGGGWQYIQVPVARHPMETTIHDVRIAPDEDWQPRVLNKLAHYRSTAPYFAETMELVEASLLGGREHSIGALNCRVVRMVCEALSIRSEIIVSSEYGFDYAGVAEPGDWALAHALQLGATEIINPLNGISLQNTRKLAAHEIGLSALHPPTEVYGQGSTPFEPALSIIDVMMFNGMEGTRRLLAKPTLSHFDSSENHTRLAREAPETAS